MNAAKDIEAAGKQLTPYEKGFAAHNRGEGAHQNPYMIFTSDRLEWLCGWTEAYTKDSK